MVHVCSVINCSARKKKGVSLKFHEIPIKDISLRKAWLHALRRLNFDPKCGYVCEKHFIENDYEINVYGNKVLKKGSVPSVFNFSPHHKTRTLKRKLCVPGKLKELAPKVGHTPDQDLGRLFMSKAEKQVIAAKIAANIPMDEILDDIRDSVSGCPLERQHLLTKKDLYNLDRVFNLNSSSRRRKNDAVRVDIWENTSNEYSELKPADVEMSSVSVGESTSCQSKKLLKEKQKLFRKVSELILSVKSMEELEVIEKILAQIEPALEAIRSKKNRAPEASI